MAIIKKYGARFYFLVLAIAVTMRNAKPAWAATHDSTTTLPEVLVSARQDKKSYKAATVSSSKYVGPLVDVPQTITVIPQAVMQDQGATTLREVLRNTPGISMQAGEGGTPAGDQMTIRGFSARTDIFVDNVRDFGGYSRDPFNLEQVEVVKGPASSYAGRGSTGGSVNLVSKAPSLDAANQASVGFGTERYQRYTVDVNQPLDQLALEGTAVRFNALYHRAGVSERDVVRDERWGFAPSVAFGLETPTRLVLSYFHLDQDNVPDYGQPWVPANNATGPLAGLADQPAPVDRANYYGLIDRDYERVGTDIFTVKMQHDFTDDLAVENIFRYGRTDRDSIITPPRFSGVSNDTIARSDWKSRDQVDEIFSEQLDVDYKFETGSLRHEAVFGIDLSREEEVNYGRAASSAGPVTSLFDPDAYQDFDGTISRNGQDAHATSDSAGVFASDNVKLNDRWEVSGGLRWDYFDVKAIPITGTPPVAGEPLQHTDRILSWRTGIVYKPRENGSVYAAYGTSFNPSAEGLTLTGATNTLDPEKNKTYEAGTKWEFFKKALTLTGAIFRTDKSNARTPGLPGEAPTVLSGEQRVQGIELGAAGEITEAWKVFGGYTLLYSDITESNTAGEVGNHVSNTPDSTFNLWTTYALPWNMDVGFGANYTGERFNSNANTRKARPYWLLDAMLAYHVREDLTVRLNVYNLANEDYIDRMSGGHYIPGAGRSATLSADFKF